MARTDTLGNFLTDVADAIREKKGTSEEITASDFDTEIASISGGGGADLSEYFETEVTSNPVENSTPKLIKKIPTINIADTVTSLVSFSWSIGSANIDNPIKIVGGRNVTETNNMFYTLGRVKNLDLSELNTSNVTNMQSMFNGCNQLLSLDLSNFDTTKLTNINYMFQYCRNLMFLDMRTFEFTKITNKNSVFTSDIPANCEIIVKDQTQKDWITTNYSRLTNVKTVAEYEAEQNA